MVCQVVHHGIGVMVTPAQLAKEAGKPLLDAITTVLTQPTNKVCLSQQTCPSNDALAS